MQFHWRDVEIAVNVTMFKLVPAAKRRDLNAKAGGRGAGQSSVRIVPMSSSIQTGYKQGSLRIFCPHLTLPPHQASSV